MANSAKFRELILYLARESEGDDYFGAIKLNKLLFNIDFEAYRRFGRSVTGQEYQRLPYGPAPRAVVPTLNNMVEQRELVIREEPLSSYTQKRPIALRQPNVNLFSSEEVALIAHIVLHFWYMSASQISDHSHRFIGWAVAEEGETIPYEVALLGKEELTEQELEYAKIAEERARKWLASRAA